jgi:hypothetical protein
MRADRRAYARIVAIAECDPVAAAHQNHSHAGKYTVD